MSIYEDNRAVDQLADMHREELEEIAERKRDQLQEIADLHSRIYNMPDFPEDQLELRSILSDLTSLVEGLINATA